MLTQYLTHKSSINNNSNEYYFWEVLRMCVWVGGQGRGMYLQGFCHLASWGWNVLTPGGSLVSALEAHIVEGEVSTSSGLPSVLYVGHASSLPGTTSSLLVFPAVGRGPLYLCTLCTSSPTPLRTSAGDFPGLGENHLNYL